MLENTILAVEIENDRKTILTEDFNFKEVKWKDFVTEDGENTGEANY